VHTPGRAGERVDEQQFSGVGGLVAGDEIRTELGILGVAARIEREVAVRRELPAGGVVHA